MLDDSQGNAKRTMLIGTALLTTIDLLISQGLFTNTGSKIRNLGLILSMFFEFAEDAGEHECNEDGWNYEIVKKADAHDITIEGLVSSYELVERVRDIDDSSDNSEEEEDMTEMDPEELTTYMSERYQSIYHASELGEKRSWKQYDWDIEVRHTYIACYIPPSVRLIMNSSKPTESHKPSKFRPTDQTTMWTTLAENIMTSLPSATRVHT